MSCSREPSASDSTSYSELLGAPRRLSHGAVNIAATASPELVPSPTVGSWWLPSPNSFQASINTDGGVGEGSGLSCAFALVQAMASLTKVATSSGGRLYHRRFPVLGSVSFHGRGSQPAMAVGSAPGGHALLGYWIIPVGLILGIALLAATTATLRWLRRFLRPYRGVRS